MTFALKFVFLLLLELCAFVEYDLGKFRTFTNHFKTRLAVSLNFTLTWATDSCFSGVILVRHHIRIHGHHLLGVPHLHVNSLTVITEIAEAGLVSSAF